MLYYYGARYLDPKYSMWISTDPALGEYVSQTSKGEGGIYNSVNLNLYHYAGNNPIKYTDPDGRIQYPVQGKYEMQKGDWSTEPIKNTDTPIRKAGCAIVASANLISTARFPGYDPIKVNDECVSKGLVNWEDVGKKVEMKVEVVRNSEFSGSVFNEQNDDKDTRYYTLVNVNYDSNGGDHWVGVIGMETIDGTDYLKVSPTSENDSVVGKESLRGKQGWRKNSEGDILVPTSQTKGYVNFTKEINNEN